MKIVILISLFFLGALARPNSVRRRQSVRRPREVGLIGKDLILVQPHLKPQLKVQEIEVPNGKQFSRQRQRAHHAQPAHRASPTRLEERTAKILRDERIYSAADGRYSFDFETDNGILISEGGQPEGEAQAVYKTGVMTFPLDDGSTFTLKFVANDNGYQPESDFLPVAPSFPHVIPQFVLDQIAFGQQLRAERERQGQTERFRELNGFA